MEAQLGERFHLRNSCLSRRKPEFDPALSRKPVRHLFDPTDWQTWGDIRQLLFLIFRKCKLRDWRSKGNRASFLCLPKKSLEDDFPGWCLARLMTFQACSVPWPTQVKVWWPKFQADVVFLDHKFGWEPVHYGWYVESIICCSLRRRTRNQLLNPCASQGISLKKQTIPENSRKKGNWRPRPTKPAWKVTTSFWLLSHNLAYRNKLSPRIFLVGQNLLDATFSPDWSFKKGIEPLNHVVFLDP